MFQKGDVPEREKSSATRVALRLDVTGSDGMQELWHGGSVHRPIALGGEAAIHSNTPDESGAKPKKVKNESCHCLASGCRRRSAACLMIRVRIARPWRHKQGLRTDVRFNLISQRQFRFRNR
jgi:hypothetical protein